MHGKNIWRGLFLFHCCSEFPNRSNILGEMQVQNGYKTANKLFYCTLSDIPMFYIKYLTMQKVHMHAGAKRQLLYGCAYVREIIHSLKLVDYLPIHTHKPYNNLVNIRIVYKMFLQIHVITIGGY